MLYTISEIAEKFNVAPSTLRYYDKEGLLPFVERSSSGIRMFKDEDFQWLSIIECLKKTGMSVKDIKNFIDLCMEGDSTINQRLSIIIAQRQSVLKQLEEMQKTIQILDYKKWYYETAQKAGTCKIHDTLKESDIPEKFHDALKRTKAL